VLVRKGLAGQDNWPDLPPLNFRIALAKDLKLWASGHLVTGGAPWRLARLGPEAARFVAHLRSRGSEGLRLSTDREQLIAREFLGRGFAHPLTSSRPTTHEVTVVVPAFDRVEALRRCLAALSGFDVLVVDDASKDATSVREAADFYHAGLLRRTTNGGAAAARNSGFRSASSSFVAFVDSDCVPQPGWLDQLMPHFDDPLVAVVAPRISPDLSSGSFLARHEAVRSALDMGPNPALVRPGARLGFVPGATLVVRSRALEAMGFDESLRIGEDVDFVWRLSDAGWLVRYEPRAVVLHEGRTNPAAWFRRRFEYGTSAAALAHRHPGRLAPARPSAWSLLIIALLATRRPLMASLMAGIATALLTHRLRRVGGGVTMAGTVVAMGVVADGVALGHALRREW
jgi:mycofactocin system glycosyltransferase